MAILSLRVYVLDAINGLSTAIYIYILCNFVIRLHYLLNMHLPTIILKIFVLSTLYKYVFTVQKCNCDGQRTGWQRIYTNQQTFFVGNLDLGTRGSLFLVQNSWEMVSISIFNVVLRVFNSSVPKISKCGCLLCFFPLLSIFLSMFLRWITTSLNIIFFLVHHFFSKKLTTE